VGNDARSSLIGATTAPRKQSVNPNGAIISSSRSAEHAMSPVTSVPSQTIEIESTMPYDIVGPQTIVAADSESTANVNNDADCDVANKENNDSDIDLADDVDAINNSVIYYAVEPMFSNDESHELRQMRRSQNELSLCNYTLNSSDALNFTASMTFTCDVNSAETDVVNRILDKQNIDWNGGKAEQLSVSQAAAVGGGGTTMMVAAPRTSDIGSILMVMIMYYFQDAVLFHVKTVDQENESKARQRLKILLLGLFQFRLEVAHFVDNVCLLVGLSSSQKLLAKTLIIPYCWSLFGLLYLAYCARVLLRSGCSKGPNSDGPFLCRLSNGFIFALLFTYQRLCETAFALLNCVTVGDDIRVLFIEGSVQCYQTWQYSVLAYTVGCILLFSVVIMVGPRQLRSGNVSLTAFFAGCLLPIPFLIYCVIICCCKKLDRSLSYGVTSDVATSGASAGVAKVLQNPFRETRCPLLGPVCWSGFMIFRRMILVVIFTFIRQSLIRIVVMLVVTFVIFCHHAYVRPYKDARANLAGSASLAALLVVGGINLVRAGFEAAEYVPRGPIRVLASIINETENVMLFWFPLCAMCVILVILSVKILICAFRKLAHLQK